jgi:alpha-beta hydrolase superfamily lysophospholipase
MAEHDRFQIETFIASDGYAWKYRYYPPAGPARGLVIGLHGIQSHGGWYTWSSSRLSDAGYAVYFLDRRGAGLNQAARGDCTSYHRLVDDVAEFLHHLRGDRSDRFPPPKDHRDSPPARPPGPIILMGISWGGRLAAAVEKFHPGLCDAIALLCPGLFSTYDRQVTWWKTIKVMLTRQLWPRRKYPIPLSDPWLFTDSPRWRQFIADDPLMLREGTARMAYSNGCMTSTLCAFAPGCRSPLYFVHLFRQLYKFRRIRPPVIRVPVLLLLAENDRIIDNDLTRHYLERICQNRLEVIEYPGANHTLEFEPDPELHLHDLLGWLERQCVPASCAAV